MGSYLSEISKWYFLQMEDATVEHSDQFEYQLRGKKGLLYLLKTGWKDLKHE
jgi:hypothetical protein